MPELMFTDPNSDISPNPLPSRGRELLIAVLQVAAALLALVPYFSPWAARHRNYALLVVVVVIGWIAKPRLEAWIKRRRYLRRDQQFTAENAARLRNLVERLAIFTNHDTRSLIQILRSAYSQNMLAVERIISGDYIGNWFYCYQEQLRFPGMTLEHFLSQCREFSHILQAFNTYYVLHAQRKLAATTPLSEDNIARLEEFREEYNAFLRDVEPWAQGIASYLQQSKGVRDHSTLWGLAPTNSFERPKSFRQTKPVGA
jgi:hypothetical protein